MVDGREARKSLARMYRGTNHYDHKCFYTYLLVPRVVACPDLLRARDTFTPSANSGCLRSFPTLEPSSLQLSSLQLLTAHYQQKSLSIRARTSTVREVIVPIQNRSHGCHWIALQIQRLHRTGWRSRNRVGWSSLQGVSTTYNRLPVQYHLVRKSR